MTGIIYQSDIKLKFYNISVGGIFKRNESQGEFFIPVVGLKYGEFLLNMSYDINISGKNNGQRGATEITLIFTSANTRARYLEDKFIRY